MDMWLCITLLVPCEQNVFSKRLKAALLEFRLLTGSRRLFLADGPAITKAC